MAILRSFDRPHIKLIHQHINTPAWVNTHGSSLALTDSLHNMLLPKFEESPELDIKNTTFSKFSIYYGVFMRKPSDTVSQLKWKIITEEFQVQNFPKSL